jgi:hypothetical protein
MGPFGREKRIKKMQSQLDSLNKRMDIEIKNILEGKSESDIKTTFSEIRAITAEFRKINTEQDLDLESPFIVKLTDKGKSYDLNDGYDFMVIREFYLHQITLQKYNSLKKNMLENPPTIKDGVDDRCREIIMAYRKQWIKISIDQSVKKYFQLLSKIDKYSKEKNFNKMISTCDTSLTFLEPLIIQERLFDWYTDNMSFDNFNEYLEGIVDDADKPHQILSEKYNRFILGDDTIPEMKDIRIKGMPAIELKLRYEAVNLMGGGIKNMEGIINYFPDLKRLFSETLEQSKVVMKYSSIIQKYIKGNPGTMQSQLRKNIKGIEDGKLASNICNWLDQYGKLERKKSGKSYELTLK